MQPWFEHLLLIGEFIVPIGNRGRYTIYCTRLQINMSVCLSIKYWPWKTGRGQGAETGRDLRLLLPSKGSRFGHITSATTRIKYRKCFGQF